MIPKFKSKELKLFLTISLVLKLESLVDVVVAASYGQLLHFQFFDFAANSLRDSCE